MAHDSRRKDPRTVFILTMPVSVSSLKHPPSNTNRRHMKNYVAAVTALCVLAIGTAARADEELTGTLKKIKDSGTIAVGHRESSVPFSYYDDKNQVVGYSQDLV